MSEIKKIRRWIRKQRTAIEQSYKPKQKYSDWDRGYTDCLSALNEYLEEDYPNKQNAKHTDKA